MHEQERDRRQSAKTKASTWEGMQAWVRVGERMVAAVPRPNMSDHSPYDMVAANSGSMYPGVPATYTTQAVDICPRALVHGTDQS